MSHCTISLDMANAAGRLVRTMLSQEYGLTGGLWLSTAFVLAALLSFKLPEVGAGSAPEVSEPV